MNRRIMMLINVMLLMYALLSECGPKQSVPARVDFGHLDKAEEEAKQMLKKAEEQKWRNMLNFYITTKTSFSAIGMHDIIERTGLDINAVDENELTPLQLAQKEGNGIAVAYLLWRGARDSNLARSVELLDSIDRPITFTSIEPMIVGSNTTTITAPSAPPAQPAPAPATPSPEISGYAGPKRLKQSPSSYGRHDDHDGDN